MLRVLKGFGCLVALGILVVVAALGGYFYWLTRIPTLDASDWRIVDLDGVAEARVPSGLQRARLNSLQVLMSDRESAPRMGDGPFSRRAINPAAVNFALDFGGKTNLGGMYETAMLLTISIVESPSEFMPPERLYYAGSGLSDHTFWNAEYDAQQPTWSADDRKVWFRMETKDQKLGAILVRRDRKVQVMALWKPGIGDRAAVEKVVAEIADGVKIKRSLQPHFSAAHQHVDGLQAETKPRAAALVAALKPAQLKRGIQMLPDDTALRLTFPLFGSQAQPLEFSYAVRLGRYKGEPTKKLAAFLRDLAKLGPGNQRFVSIKVEPEDKRTRLILTEDSVGQPVGLGNGGEIVFDAWSDANSTDRLAFLVWEGAFRQDQNFEEAIGKLKLMRDKFREGKFLEGQ